MNKYYVEIYNKETNQEVFTLEVINGEFDAAQKKKHDEILLADTELKYSRRIFHILSNSLAEEGENEHNTETS